MVSEGPQQLSIFISHRHEDKHIADVFREAFEDWSNGSIKVFQSSHAKNALVIGEHLDGAVKAAIASSNVVLLIYTTENTDWSWCMYECGLAQDPEVLHNTRLVIFHSTEEPPAPLQHLVSVPFAKETLRALVDDFHRDATFFPRATGAMYPGLNEEQIDERAQELYEELHQLIPNIRAREVQRYDHITLGLDLELVVQLRNFDREASQKEAMGHAKEVIKENAIVRSVVGEPQAHFNYEDIAEGMKFSQMVDRWKKESEYSGMEWQEELYDEMARAVLNRKERAISSVFNSLEPDTNTWFLPILSHFRILPDENSAEFDVLLCGIKAEVASKMSEVLYKE